MRVHFSSGLTEKLKMNCQNLHRCSRNKTSLLLLDNMYFSQMVSQLVDDLSVTNENAHVTSERDESEKKQHVASLFRF